VTATESDCVLDASNEVVDIVDVRLGQYLDDVSLAFSFIQSRAEETDFFG